MQTIEQLRSAGLACFPCKQDKSPAVIQNWQEAAILPLNVLQKSAIGGIPVPSGIVIVDLDLYKGITRTTAEDALGCKIDWASSLIQTTRSGGEHHAFQVDCEINQRSNYPIEGLDTKVSGKGYICFGYGYTPKNGEGVLRLLNRTSLPRLPAEAVWFLAVSERSKPSFVESSVDSMEASEIAILSSALASISPWCSREIWVKVGMSLKTAFGSSRTGFDLFDNWSRGRFWQDKTEPENYVARTQVKQWNSFKSNGARTLLSIYSMARENSWQFPLEIVAKMLGPSPPGLIEYPVVEIEDITVYLISYSQTKCHRVSALELIGGTFRNRIKCINGRIYIWAGRQWKNVFEKALKNLVWRSLPSKADSHHVFSGIYKAFLIAIPDSEIAPPCKRIFYRNGVLDSETGEFKNHQKENLNLGTLSVDYKSDNLIVEWEKFLISIFGSLDDFRVKLLQEIFGWLMITHNLGIEKYIALVGVTRAGKGIVLRVLMSILGRDFSGPVNFSNIGTPQGHSALWKYNVTVDMEAKMPKKDERMSALDTLQKVTSNEIMSSRRLYHNDNLEGQVNCRLIIACNKLPVFSDDSGASANRALMLVFTNTFLGNEDFHLIDKLKEENTGIAFWASEGIKRLVSNGGIFTVPDSSKEAMVDLEDMSKPLGEFIKDHIIVNINEKCSTRELFEVYKRYCEVTGLRIMNKKIFISALKESLLAENVKWVMVRIGEKTERGIRGVRLVDKFPGLGLSPSSPVPDSSTNKP